MVNIKELSVSVIIPIFNSERTLDKCLKGVFMQEYDKSKIEILAVDGGSTDRSIQIARKYGARIITVDLKKQNAEYNKGIGLSKAKNEIVLFLDHDNIIPHKNWLKKIMIPLSKEKDVVAVEPIRFYYDRKMSLLDRYFALIGGVDPVAYYLKKNSHLSYATSKYNLLGNSEDKGEYYKVTFSQDSIPALGGNGAAIRRKVLLKNAKCDPANFFHIDVHVDLIKKGFNQYAFTKDSIKHLTNNKFLPFIKRRKYFIEKYHFKENKRRRYSVYEAPKDNWNLLLYIIFSVTIVVPLSDAIKGYLKVRDVAWFMHPVMCICLLIAYGIPTFKQGVRYVFLEK